MLRQNIRWIRRIRFDFVAQLADVYARIIHIIHIFRPPYLFQQFALPVAQGWKENYGFNAASEEYETDMLKAGIIDPTKVSRTAIENASSVAGLLLMTEALIADEPEEEKAPPMPAGGGMGGMY